MSLALKLPRLRLKGGSSLWVGGGLVAYVVFAFWAHTWLFGVRPMG